MVFQMRIAASIITEDVDKYAKKKVANFYDAVVVPDTNWQMTNERVSVSNSCLVRTF
jgi:hypothetical protein